MTFDFFSLDYLYYPVSGIMWVWHKVWGALLGPTNGWGWVLSVVFLVFTLRLLLFKPFMKQMDSQLKMQAIQPQMKKLREKYAGDRQRLAEEMMKLNKENGVSAVGGCLPALIQAPVFIGLFHVLRMFQPQQDKLPGGGLGPLYFKGQVYFFGAQDVQHFGQATLFGGAPLGGSMSMRGEQLAFMGGDHTTIIWVGVPLTILAGIMTHLTSRRSVARQASLNPDAAANPQSAIMNKLMLYVFPAFVVIGGPFFPLAILFYWLANNSWTFGQLWFAHRIQDKRKSLQAAVIIEEKQSQRFTKPAPGARPATVVVDSDVNLSKGSGLTDDPTATSRAVTRPSPGARPSGSGGQRPNRPGNRPSSNAKKKRKR